MSPLPEKSSLPRREPEGVSPGTAIIILAPLWGDVCHPHANPPPHARYPPAIPDAGPARWVQGPRTGSPCRALLLVASIPSLAH